MSGIESQTQEDCTLYAVAARSTRNKPTWDAGTAVKCLYAPLVNHVETDLDGKDVVVDGLMIFRPGVTISEEYRVTYDGNNFRIVRLIRKRMPGQLYIHHYEVFLKRTK